jgi:hypothetical protein
VPVPMPVLMQVLALLNIALIINYSCKLVSC